MTRGKKDDATGKLFIEDSGQLRLLDKSAEQTALEGESVECLGRTFPSDDARREHYLDRLRGKLQNPEFRKTPGFPKGMDEDILRLSDPPYYTACPNPFLEDYVKQHGQPFDPNDSYHREPFAVDVSVGKTDALYKAHGYHTKVPHLAIVPSILHYTKPGDIVLDGFCGSGLTGVAAQFCGSAPSDYRKQIEMQWKKEGREPPQWGPRRAVLGDLGPAATFIAANYNLPFDVRAFEREAKRILEEVRDEIGWMYETLHTSGAGFQPASAVFTANARKEHPHSLQEFKATRRDLPHWQYPGAILFVTFNTYHRVQLSPASRDAVMAAIRHWHGSRIHLFAAVVMPDHAHMVFKLLADEDGKSVDLAQLMHSIKSYSANQVNRIEGREGILWQAESYDHVVRDERDFHNTLSYIYHNPFRKGLCSEGEGYPWFVSDRELEDAGWKPAPLGRINYTVWSEVFSCPNCAGEIVFVKEALDPDTKRVRDAFPCPGCGAGLTKQRMERFYETRQDAVIGRQVRSPKRVPVLVN